MMADTVPEMGASFMDECDDLAMNVAMNAAMNAPFSLIVDTKLEAKHKIPPARLSGFDGLFSFAFEAVPEDSEPDFVPQLPDITSLARRSSVLHLAQQLREEGAADATPTPADATPAVATLKAEPQTEQSEPSFNVGQLPEVERATGAAHDPLRAALFPTARSSASSRATNGVTKQLAMKKVKVGPLPANHKPARGRGRSKQLAKMTQAQKKAEQQVRMEKNRLAAKEFRARRKNRVEALEQTVQEHEQRTQEQQESIHQLQQQVLLLKQQLSCQQ